MRKQKLVGQALGLLVSVYQLFIRPLLPPVCRFEPSCSEYYRMALATRGPLEATWLAVRRICRCHPWDAGGYDPPPAPGRVPRVQRSA